MHYGNIFEYLSLWGEVQFLKIQKSKKKSKKSKNLTNLDFTPETYQKIETLPKALWTQVLTALASNFGLVGLVRWVWLSRFGLVGLVW